MPRPAWTGISVFAILIICAVIPPLGSDAKASVSVGDAYYGQNKLLNDFESSADESNAWGDWTLAVQPGHPELNVVQIWIPYSVPHGNKAVHISSSVSGFTSQCTAYYRWDSNLAVDPLRIYEITMYYYPWFDFHGYDHWYDWLNNTNIDIKVIARAYDVNGTVISEIQRTHGVAYYDYNVLKLNQWTALTFNDLYANGAVAYSIIWQWWFNGDGNFALSLDWMTAESPASDIRFSYFNIYTGLGLISELLVPTVWWQGMPVRVWNNEIQVAVGENITYQISDYFGQVLSTGAVFLSSTIVFIDISVPLVKVQISRPEWYNSMLPPEWDITYLPSGQILHAVGWELEVIAGWYQLTWPGNDAMAAGTLDLYVEGNATHRNSYSLLDFGLVLEPTWSVSSNSNSLLAGGGFTLGNVSGWFQDLLDTASYVHEAQWFKLISVAGVAVMIAGWAWAAKRKAAKLAKEQAAQEAAAKTRGSASP
jgi:hypothetical protein